jgi:hypothetical protein
MIGSPLLKEAFLIGNIRMKGMTFPEQKQSFVSLLIEDTQKENLQ